ncbi:MAG TPA: hypothetical protein VMR62_15930 [Bryobacteraceae bacterium]|jgi:FixJ family two-component response regulator|nr:hypothetical protein [Bryobacteraceae bacterium]
MNGLQLAEALTAFRTDMKVVLMSGHACELHVFRAGWQFLLKPFTPGTLVSTVEEALGWRLRPKLVA